MNTEAVKPEGTYCYVIDLLKSYKECPKFDQEVTLHPKCFKYSVELKWNTSGHVLKCDECLKKEEKNG